MWGGIVCVWGVLRASAADEGSKPGPRANRSMEAAAAGMGGWEGGVEQGRWPRR